MFLLPKKKRSLLAAGSLLLATVFWGGSFVVVKDSLDTLPPIYMIAVRFTIAGAVLSLFFLKKLLQVRRKTLLRSFVLSLLLFLAYAFQTVGCVYTTAGKNAFLTTVYVIFVPLAAWFASGQKPRFRAFIAAAMAMTGMALLSLNEALRVNLGDALTIICGFWYALHMVYIARFTRREDPVTLTILQMFFAAALAWAFAPWYDGAFPARAVFFALRPALSVLYLALFPSAAAFLLQNLGQKYLPSGTASLLLSMEAVFGAFFSALFLGESMTPRMLCGCALLFLAIVYAAGGGEAEAAGEEK